MAPSAGIGVSVTPSKYWSQTVEAIKHLVPDTTPVTVTAAGETITAAVSTAHLRLHLVRHVDWYVAAIDEHTMSVPAHTLKDRRYRISDDLGWHTPTGSVEPARRAAKPAISRTAVSATTLTRGFAQHLAALVQAPAVTHVQFAVTPAGVVGLSATSSVISSAVSTGRIDDTAHIVALPVELAAAIATLLAEDTGIDDPELKLTVDPTKLTVTIAAGNAVITATSRTLQPLVPWPSRPEPDLERHDLIITSLTPWHHVSDHAAAANPPFPTTHLRWDKDTQMLTILTRIGNTTIDLELPATSSDRFALDLPWPALQALLAGAAGVNQVGLRYFTPNPTLTHLVADYVDEPFAGFAVVGARRPDGRLNSH